jgi:glycosyltransferase involved in cell wall biosynthesis
MGKITVLCFISSLAGGGAERVMVDLLSNIDRSRFEPTLVLLYPYEDSPYKQNLPQDLRVVVVDRKSDSVPAKLRQALAFFQAVRKEKPDVILSMLTHNNIMALLSGLLFRIRVIACEHNTLSEVTKTEEGGKIMGMPVALMVKTLYRFADKIIAVSEGIKSDLISAFRLSPDAVQTIYNPVDLDRFRSLLHDSPVHPFFTEQKPVVIAMGRLTQQKGFDMLLKAFSRVLSAADARLVIMGEGPQRTSLEELVKELGIEEKVSLSGFQRNPYAMLAHSDIFVLSSRYEGLPMAMLEAMACGLPVIATDCRSGPREILQNGECGNLVPVGNEAAMADAILELLEDSTQRERLSEHGKERVKEYLAPEIVRQYEEIICREASSRRKRTS